MFVSYAREDQAFVRWLVERLGGAGREAWVDWEDIPPTATWWDEITAAIEGAPSIVVVVSNAWLQSHTCDRELEHAAASGKRIVPLILEEPDRDAPQAVAARNWLFFRAEDDKEAAFAELISALDTDLDWVRAHTRLLVRAVEWEQAKSDRSLLLRGRELAETDTLAAASGGRQPPLTEQQSRYLVACRRARSRRQRASGIVSIAILVIFALLAVVAVVQRNAAEDQRNTARQQRDIAQSRQLAAAAREQVVNDSERGLLLALEAYKAAPTAESVAAIRQTAFAQSLLGRWSGDWIADGAFNPMKLNADGTHFVTGGVDGGTSIWRYGADSDTGVRCDDENMIGPYAWLPDQPTVVGMARSFAFVDNTATDDQLESTSSDPGSLPSSSAVLTCGLSGSVEQLPLEIAIDDYVLAIAVSAGAQRIVVGTDSGAVHVIEEGAARQIGTVEGGQVNFVWISPDGGMVRAATEHGRVLEMRADDGAVTREWSFVGTGLTVDFTATDATGSRLAITYDDVVAVLDMESGEQIAELVIGDESAYSLAMSGDGRNAIMAAQSGAVLTWQIGVSPEPATYRSQGHLYLDAAIAPDGSSALALTDNGEAAVFAPGPTGRPLGVGPPTGRQQSATAVSYSPDGAQLLVGYGDGTVRLVDPAAGTVLFTVEPSAEVGSTPGPILEAGGDPVTSLVFASDGVYAGTGRGGVRKFDIEEAQWSTIGTLGVASRHARTSVASMNGNTVAASTGASTAFDSTSIEEEAPYDGVSIADVVFNADGSRLAFAGQTSGVTISSYPITFDGSVDDILPNEAIPGYPTSLFWRPGASELLVGTSTGGVLRWSGHQDDPPVPVGNHTGLVVDTNVTSDGRWLATAANDGSVRVWDLVDGGDPLVIDFGAIRPTGVSWRPDTHELAITTSDGALRVYNCTVCVPTNELIREALRIPTRQLDADERKRFGLT